MKKMKIKDTLSEQDKELDISKKVRIYLCGDILNQKESK